MPEWGNGGAVDRARGSGESFLGITNHAPAAHRRAEAFTCSDLGLLLQQEIEVGVIVVPGETANTPLNGSYSTFTQPES